jgi:hypothetical protein
MFYWGADYYWNAVVHNIKKKPFLSREALIEQIEQACSQVDSKDIRKSVVSFAKRVRTVEKNKGKYIKK